MTESRTGNGANELAFEAFGVRAIVSASRPEELDRVSVLLPPGWRPCDPSSAEERFGLVADERGRYGVTRGGNALTEGVELDLALAVLDAQLRAYVSLQASDTIFVHAGVVAHSGRTIVVPGRSFVGKTTLVASLVHAGALYYSDEFAVLDGEGLVHPYAKPLSLRGADHLQTDHHVDALGGMPGDEPLPVGLVVVTSYRPGADWRPRRLSAGEGVLALLSNTVVAQERPEEALRALTRAVEGSVVMESERGEADAVAPLLLAEIAR